MKKLLRYVFNYRKNKRFKDLIIKIGVNKTIQLQTDVIVSKPEKLIIEDYVYIGPNAHIQAIGGVTIKRGVIIGPDLKIYSANHRFRKAESIPYDSTYIKKPVLIGENVWIGGGVTIVPGTIIGEGAIIGAGTVLSGEIEPLSIVIGNPCKIINKRDEKEYYKLKSEDKIYLKLKQENYFNK